MTEHPKTANTVACVTVKPGICGLPCRMRAMKRDSYTVTIEFDETECKQVQRLAVLVDAITMQQLFAPVTRNPVYVAAQKAGCHASCPVPPAILKAAEVAMGMALPKTVTIDFADCREAENE